MLRWILLVCGMVLTLDTCFAATVCNFNLGVILPAILGLPLLLIGIFWKPLRKFFACGWGKAVKRLLIGGYTVWAVTFAIVTGCIVRQIADVPEPEADAVIVLGAAVRGDVPSATLAARLDCAYAYLADNPETVVIVTGGQGNGEAISEAQASCEYLLKKGVDASRIYLEDQSTSTQENLINAEQIIRDYLEHADRIVVVSSDFHLYRAKLTAKALGMDVETMGSRSIVWLIPNFYLREYAAVMGYRILGYLG